MNRRALQLSANTEVAPITLADSELLDTLEFATLAWDATATEVEEVELQLQTLLKELERRKETVTRLEVEAQTRKLI